MARIKVFDPTKGEWVYADMSIGGSAEVPSGGGGGTEKMRLIAEVTTTEDLKSFEISEDGEGKPFSLRRVAIHMKLQGADSKNANVYGTANGKMLLNNSVSISGTSAQNLQFISELLANGQVMTYRTSPLVNSFSALNSFVPFATGSGVEIGDVVGNSITSVGFMTYQSILAGAKIVVWGC